MKVNIYVDGFNLYYGAVKGTPYRWLNIAEMCRLLLPHDQILQIKYFTAKVNPRPTDPDQRSRLERLRLARTDQSRDAAIGEAGWDSQPAQSSQRRLAATREIRQADSAWCACEQPVSKLPKRRPGKLLQARGLVSAKTGDEIRSGFVSNVAIG